MLNIKELETKIKSAQEAYYNASSIMDDDEYDALVYDLQTADPTNKLLSVIGAEPANEWKKEKHLYPLGSLNKVNTPTEMSKWITENLAGRDVLLVEKLDGLSVGCQYDNGRLVKGMLRGGGTDGENILSNILKMHGVVKSIPGFTGVLRGEIVLTKTNHQTYFVDKANPRNAASGVCRRLDGEGCEHLTLMFYQVLGKDFETEVKQFEFLKSAGCIIPFYKLCNASQVNDLWKEYQDKTRASLDYEIDGLVVSCNDIAFQTSLGQSNLRPKGKMAFKFANQFIKTSIRDISWTTGNSGRITPICWFEPVNLLGSLISKASAYNVAYITKLGLDVGAEVLICKAGEIIPRVEKVVKSTGTIVAIPTNCPECSAKLEMQGEYLFCPNTASCPSQIIGRLKNWIKELNVLEWGESLLEKLVLSGKVNTVADLYKLTIDDLMSIDRMGKKSATKCYDILSASKEVPLDIFLGGLSIPMIGGSTIRAIMSAGHDTLEKISQLSASDLEKVPGVGPTKAKSLADGLKSNQKLISELLTNGVFMKEKVEGKLSGMSFALTGALSIKRVEVEKMIVENGGEVKGSVGKTTQFLIIAEPDSTSSKAVAARKLGVKLINEDQFINMIA